MKKILKWGGIIFLVLIVITAIAGGGSDEGKKVGENSDTSTTSPQVQNEPSEAQPVEAPSTYKVGDKIELGDVIVSVNEVETSAGGQYTKPSEGNQWIDVNMTIENTGSDQEYITTMGQMFILDDQNNQYQVAVTGKRLENSGSMGLDGAIVAKAKKTDWVGFEVPKTAKGLKLQYNASFFNDKNIEIDLGL
jgi:hypothetical protein